MDATLILIDSDAELLRARRQLWNSIERGETPSLPEREGRSATMPSHEPLIRPTG
jgi:hypothetical protein